MAKVCKQDSNISPGPGSDTDDSSGNSDAYFLDDFVVETNVPDKPTRPIWKVNNNLLRKYTPYKNKPNWYIASNCYLGLRGCGKKFRTITAKFIRLEKRKQVVKIETSLKYCRNAEEAKEDIREEESTSPQIDISMVEESRRHQEFTTVPADGIVNPSVRTPPIRKHKNYTIASFTEVLSRDPVVFPDEESDNEDLHWESSSVMTVPQACSVQEETVMTSYFVEVYVLQEYCGQKVFLVRS
ncbi:protein of unknown function (DUF4211) [Branchiostoma belcheri]|nr:protein of unknown function (DUF4211) [Branchiostoma belcheri]